MFCVVAESCLHGMVVMCGSDMSGFRAEKQILERVVLWPLERQAKFEKVRPLCCVPSETAWVFVLLVSPRGASFLRRGFA